MKLGDLVKRTLNGREEVALIIEKPSRITGGILTIDSVTVMTRLGKGQWNVSKIEVINESR
tara:strand:- start:499 stop:681 length:183 start_codon:yes stop_codon:yes gene_type:complete